MVQTAAYLKTRFAPGSQPSAQDFADLIDSSRNLGSLIPGIDINGIPPDVQTAIQAIDAETGNAILTTNPADLPAILTYNVTGGAGTYFNFLSAPLTPIVFDATNDSMTTKNWQLRKVDLYWQKYEVKNVPLTNYLNKSGDVSDAIQIGANLFNPALIMAGKLIDNTGVIASNAGYKMIKVFWPATAVVGDLAVFGGINSAHNIMYCRYFDATGALISNVFQFTQGTTRNIGVPTGGAGGGIFITIRAVEDTSDAGFANAIVNMGTTLLTPYAPYTEVHRVQKIDTKYLEAKYINADSVCPTPSTDGNTANKKYVDDAKAAAIANTTTNAVMNANVGIETTYSGNLANPALIAPNMLIDSTGAYIAFTGYKAIVIPIDASNLNIAWKGINSLGNCYGRFFDASNAGLGSLINTTPNGNEYTRAIPSGAVKFIITIKTPSDSNDSGFASLMINYGTTAITPYAPYSTDYVVSINGKKVKSGSGQAYDQLLNTTNNVQFNSVTTPLLTAAGLSIQSFSMDLPQWDGVSAPPTGLRVGDLYLFTDGSIKRRMS